MSIFTAEEIETQIAAYKKALIAVARNETVEIDGDRLTFQDQGKIRDTLTWLAKEKQRIAGTRAAVTVRGRVAR